jgi:hypothetical protein
MNCVLIKWGKIGISPRVSKRGTEAAGNSWRWGGGSRSGRGSRSTNSNTASPEPATEPRRLDADLHGERRGSPGTASGRGSRSTNSNTASPEPATEPRRQNADPQHDCAGNLPRRRFLNGSGEWRGGEEVREVGGSGISRPWKFHSSRAEVSLLAREPARARQSSRRRQDSPAQRAARARLRRNET